MRQRFVTFVVFAIVLIAVGEWGLRQGKFAGLDQFWLDFCVANSGDRIEPPAVTVVRIDDGYEPLRIGEDANRPNDGSLSRLDYATILALTAKFQPRSVTFLPTPSFDESLTLNKTDIAPLKDAAMKLPRILTATTVSNDGEQAKEAAALPYPALKVEGEPAAVLGFTRTVRFPDDQILANGTPLFKSIESARDLVSKQAIRIPLVARRGDQVVPSIVLAAVANHAGVPLDQIVLKLDAGSPKILVGDVHEIPVAADGTLSLPARSGISTALRAIQRGDDGTTRPILPFATLTVDELAYTGEENDEVAKRILAELQPEFDSLARNHVVIGFDRTADRRIETGTGETLSETGLIARAIAVIQSGRYFQLWPSWLRWFVIADILILAAILYRFPRRKFLPVAVLASVTLLVAMVMGFSATLYWTPPFVIFALLGLMIAIGVLVPARTKVEA